MEDFKQEEIKELLSALEGYNFMLLQISKNRVVPVKKRKQCELGMVSVGNLINKIKNYEVK